MNFINIYHNNGAQKRKVLSSLGLNVLQSTKILNKNFHIVNVPELINKLSVIRIGVENNDINSFYGICNEKLFKPNTLFRGIGLHKNQNRFCVKKIHGVISEDKYKKDILLQRINFIIHYLAAATTDN